MARASSSVVQSKKPRLRRTCAPDDEDEATAAAACPIDFFCASWRAGALEKAGDNVWPPHHRVEAALAEVSAAKADLPSIQQRKAGADSVPACAAKRDVVLASQKVRSTRKLARLDLKKRISAQRGGKVLQLSSEVTSLQSMPRKVLPISQCCVQKSSSRSDTIWP